MNLFRRLLLRSIVRLGGLGIIRLIANFFELNRNMEEQVRFPFIKRRYSRSTQILVYHRVNDEHDPIFPGIPTKAFAEQMEYLAEHYMVCSLGEAVERIRSDDVSDNLLTITFDDGYRDNYTHAFPILARLGLPATIFLATDAIDTGRMLWQDRVFSALRTTRATTLEQFGDSRQIYPLNTPGEKRRSLMEVLTLLWSMDDSDRFLWVEMLRRQLGVDEPASCNGLMLSWDDIRVMSEHQISFGAHTMTHPVLSKLRESQVRREISESKEIIESNLRMPVKHFAYPVGRREDFTEAVKRELRNAGFECAVTTIAGSNDSTQDPLELRRVSPWDHDIDTFALRLSYSKFASC